MKTVQFQQSFAGSVRVLAGSLIFSWAFVQRSAEVEADDLVVGTDCLVVMAECVKVHFDEPLRPNWILLSFESLGADPLI